MLACETAHRVLIVDTDAAAIAPLRDCLLRESFDVDVNMDGAAALEAISNRPPNLLILDWNMPGFIALEIIRAARQPRQARVVRVMILSALADERDIVSGLEQGADDYIAKPYSLREVMARISSLLRQRSATVSKVAVNCGELRLDCATNRVSVGGQPLNLRGAEYRLLEFLMTHSGRTFSRDQLLSQVWGDQSTVDLRTVDVNVQRLRRILAEPGFENYIQTVRGFGYRFANP